MRRRLTLLVALSMLALRAGTAQAIELLVNGDLESSVSPPGWTLTQSITDLPGANVAATEQISFANEPMSAPGELGILLRTTSGNTGDYAGQNQKVNVILSQTFTGVNTSRFYTFTGHSFFANGDGLPETTNDGYSGGVTLLDTRSPSDPTPMDAGDPATVASPTVTTFKMEFLNASNVVLPTGTVTLDIRSDREAQSSPANDAIWRTHTLGGANVLGQGKPPTGATQLRVTAAANDMVENFGFQSAYFDNFSLKDNVVATERLTNGNLNAVGPPNGYTIIEGPDAGPGSTIPPPGQPGDTVRFLGFANHTPGGAQGMWLASFANTTEYEPDVIDVDGSMSQTVPGTAGGDYTFSAWSKWETNYAGGIANSGTVTMIELAFLDGSSEVIGTPLTLDLFAAGQMNDKTWRQYSLNGIAPEFTESVRITAAGLHMFNTFPTGADVSQSAFFDDFSLIEVLPDELPGDYNDDDTVDAADYVVWRHNEGTMNVLPNDPDGGTIGENQYATWVKNFGATLPLGSGAGASTVPEPACCGLALIAILGAFGIGRCRWLGR